jgi:hypothetical protein
LTKLVLRLGFHVLDIPVLFASIQEG